MEDLPDDGPERPQDNLGWWDRVFTRQDAEARQAAEEQQRAAELAAAVDDPFGPQWADQRKLLGIDGKGLDADQQHGGLRRMS